MEIQIITPDGTAFTGDADAVQLPGIDGLFQVLNNHAPLISALKEGTVKVEKDNTRQFFKIKSGIVEVLNNKISVLTEGIVV